MQDQIDNQLLTIEGLTWLPWIGANYHIGKRRLLLIGESHYLDPAVDKDFTEAMHRVSAKKLFTRSCIVDSPITSKWRNNTYENLNRVLLKTNTFDKALLWNQVSFYNFVPRLLLSRQERPSWNEFYQAWNAFIGVVTVLQPTDCIFIGLSAANSFKKAMLDLVVESSPITYLEKISGSYPRTASLVISGQTINMSFIRQTSQMFSWVKWNAFLAQEHQELLAYLNGVVFANQNAEPVFERCPDHG